MAVAAALAGELPGSGPSASSRRAAAGRCAPRGRRATPTSSPTWTSTSRPTSTRCCRWSPRWSRATATSRSAPGWRTARASSAGPKRELISRAYNLLLRGDAAGRFSDAQCGFKAIRADAARELLPLVEDTGWFFDTELLVLAERAGCASTRCRSTGSTTPTAGSTSSRRWSTTCAASAAGAATGGCRCGPIAAARRRAAAATSSVRAAWPRSRFGADRRGEHAGVPRCSTCCCAAHAAPRRANLAGAADHRRRQHRGEPAAHVRRARPRGAVRHQLQGLGVFALGLEPDRGALAAAAPPRRRRPGRWRSRSWSSRTRRDLARFVLLRGWVFRRAAPQPPPRTPSDERTPA